MLPDSDEVNLSPTELQILSELDRSVNTIHHTILQLDFEYLTLNFDCFYSRQFGFLRLNGIEHRNKKAVVIKVN